MKQRAGYAGCREILRWAFLLVILQGSVVSGNCQNSPATEKINSQAAIDSELKALDGMKDDTNKVNLLNSISYSYCTLDPDKGIVYGLKGMDLAKRLQWKKGIAWLNNALGSNYQTRTDNTNALDYYLVALKLFNELNNREGIATADGNIALIYGNLGDYSKAFDYDQNALRLYEDVHDDANAAEINKNIGYIFDQQGELNKALEYYNRSLNRCLLIGDKSKIALLYEDMGAICNEKADYVPAIDYYQKAIRIYQAANNRLKIAMNHGNIGNVYLNENDYARALDYHFKALKLFQDLLQKNSAAYEYQVIGNICVEMEAFPLAVYYENLSLRLAKETGNQELQGYVLAAIGNTYISLVNDTARIKKGLTENLSGRYKWEGNIPSSRSARLRLAIHSLKEGLGLGLKLHISQLTQYCYESLAEAYQLNGEFKKAIEFANVFHAVNDSLYARRNKEKMSVLELKNKYENQHLKDSLTAVAQERTTQMVLKRRTLFLQIAVIFSVLVIIIFSLIYFNYKRVSGLHKEVTVQKGELEKSNQEKERILQIVAHDLRSPVGYISYLCDLTLMGIRNEKRTLECLKMIKNASAGSLDLINELVGQTDIDNNSRTTEDVVPLLSECVRMLSFKASEKRQSIKLTIPEYPVYSIFNAGKIKRVFNNLIGNAIKFSNQEQAITISVEQEEKCVIIKIQDHGIGIPDNIKQDIFEIFTDSKRSGTMGEKPFGLGLYISRQIVEAHGGTIGCESKVGVGTTFCVRLPKSPAPTGSPVMAG